MHVHFLQIVHLLSRGRIGIYERTVVTWISANMHANIVESAVTIGVQVYRIATREAKETLSNGTASLDSLKYYTVKPVT